MAFQNSAGFSGGARSLFAVPDSIQRCHKNAVGKWLHQMQVARTGLARQRYRGDAQFNVCWR
jgi:hypothetical protein